MSAIDYSTLTKEQLIEVLKRRDVQAHYGLHWERQNITPDKALNRDFVGFELLPEQCYGEGPWENLVIEGDNYDALRHLATTHAGQFHLIYIDVPYNTGNKDFVYNDHFFDSRDRYRHSTWLEFIYQRLVLAKALLKEDGAIVVSIDDNELFNMGLLMNQVFGERSFLANCIWQKRYSRENRSAIGDAHEYLLIYSLKPDAFKQRRGRLVLGDKQKSVYKETGHPRGKWRAVSLSAQGFRPNQMYEIVSPITGKVFRPPEGGCWKVIKSKYDDLLAQGLIYFGKDGNAMPSRMQFLEDIDGMTPWTWWPHDEVGHTDEARKEIQDIFGTQTAFDTPKPTRLMERVLQICAPEKDALVLDFFAGSGTTAHALLRMNKADGGQRRFVVVSSREATDETPDRNLCRDVCAVRIRKAMEGYSSIKTGFVEPLGGSFAYLKAIPVPMHRFEEQLTDSMVWTFAQQASGHPLSAPQQGVSTSINGNHLIAYCANTKPSTLAALCAKLENHKGPAVVLSWGIQAVQEALVGLAMNISYVAVPQDLQHAFRQGNAQVREPEPVETEAREDQLVLQGEQP
ncbi:MULTISPECIES: site-specific DNA-methyltransferase [unclassified Pseudomonas]|uniref:site-specific DNA-methyltransferase n=1 Tax=unclassified Pseudomonas TaxID=196821 RepID=UPI0025D55D7B|nr:MULTISPECIES: site-specific DNA-methyltransferase [unclassified Pseudomonas]